jgi:hypothetical protein
MSLLSWSTKIRVSQTSQNKIDLQNLLCVVSPILGRWSVYRVGVHEGQVLGFAQDP